VCPFATDPTEAPLIRRETEANESVGLAGTSRLLIDKLTTAQWRRLGTKVGNVDDTTMLRVNRAIIVFLDSSAADSPFAATRQLGWLPDAPPE
jgi:mRNA interferase MazF